MTQIQTTWGWLVAVYLFLGGLGAGASVVAHLLSLIARDRFKSTVRFGAWFSAIALGVGSGVLLLDVGKPLRAIVLFRSFVNPNSWMMRGAWLLLVTMLVNGLSALFWTDWTQQRLARIWRGFTTGLAVWRIGLAAVAIPLNLAVAAYTGLLLGALQFRPLWYTPLLPLLFTVSALDTGVGLVCFYAGQREHSDNAHTLNTILESCVVALILLEAVVLAAFVRQMLKGTEVAVRSVTFWTSGLLSVPFWAGVVGLGLLVPLVVAVTMLLVARRRQGPWLRYAPVVAVVSCLAGGWLLRFVMLSAGMQATLISPYFLQAVEGIPLIR
jgi:formate-dependent nitrite reductase membrane component NrfD